MFIFRLWCVGAALVVSLAHVLRHNYGVIFEPTELQAYTRIVPQQIQLNFPLRSFEREHEYEIDREQFENYNIDLSIIQEWHLSMRHVNNNTFNAIQDILKDLNLSRRSRRSPGLGFVGDILYSCCGVLTLDIFEDVAGNVHNNAEILRVLKEGANRRNKQIFDLAKAGAKVHEFLKVHSTNARQLFLDNSELLKKIFQNATENIEEFRNFTERNFLVSTTYDELILNILGQTNYQVIANVLLNSLISIQDHVLPQSMLSDTKLNEIVHELTRLLETEYKNGKLLGNIRQWRKQIYGYVNNNTLTIKLTIFYAYGFQVFDVYKPMTFPIPIHSDDPTDQGYTKLQSDGNTLLGVSQDRQYYVILHENVKNPCRKVGRQWLCFASMAVTHISEPSCLSALFFDNSIEIMSHCTFLTFPEKITPSTYSSGRR